METSSNLLTLTTLPAVVERTLQETPTVDMHTHLYSEQFGDIGLWGIDDLLTYHYLIAEFFRYSSISTQEFWALDKVQQADLVWNELFIENSPVSEATRGVLTVLQKLGLDPNCTQLGTYRDYFREQKKGDYISKMLKLANVRQVVMTNDPFDPAERKVWTRKPSIDPRFKAVLRVDPLLMKWPETFPILNGWGYEVEEELTRRTLGETRRFLEEWIEIMDPIYLAVSLPPDFQFPEASFRARMIGHCVLPVCREHGLPFSMMIGVRKLVHPELRLAGDSLGPADVSVVERICALFPENRFLVSMLARENQHALCVAARKYRNLLPFGCWWFNNVPSIIDEMTRERIELLGTSFIPQHSDARVLDQLLYKWDHSRAIIGRVLIEKYSELLRTGWQLEKSHIQRDIRNFFDDNFSRWVAGRH
jgi:hypothetical protein